MKAESPANAIQAKSNLCNIRSRFLEIGVQDEKELLKLWILKGFLELDHYLTPKACLCRSEITVVTHNLKALS